MQKMALATVVFVEGSSYRRIGARMLVFEDGNWIGGVSGGCLEGDALKKAKRAILNQYPSIITYDTREEDDYQIGVGLGCNGLIKVMFVPIVSGMVFHPIEVLNTSISSREITFLYHIIQSSHKDILGRVYDQSSKDQLVNDTSKLGFDILGKLSQNYSPKSTRLRFQNDTDALDILVESIKPTVKLILMGHNKDIIGMCQCAIQLGWCISVFGRLSKMPKEVFQLTNNVFEYEDLSPNDFDAYTAFVLMTHDLDRDVLILKKLDNSKLKYIGIMGPKTRFDKLIEKLIVNDSSLNIQNLKDSYAPIGLDIGAVLPEEIHISIAAEIIAVFNERVGTSLRERIGPINE